jgi:hypothetical protein
MNVRCKIEEYEKMKRLTIESRIVIIGICLEPEK